MRYKEQSGLVAQLEADHAERCGLIEDLGMRMAHTLEDGQKAA
jgi:hypothetical protein